jgi:hypothetical protein
MQMHVERERQRTFIPRNQSNLARYFETLLGSGLDQIASLGIAWSPIPRAIVGSRLRGEWLRQ